MVSSKLRASLRFSAAPLALFATWVVFGAVNPYFFTLDNGLNIAGQTGALAIVAMGEMLVIITGGFDISVGSVAALATVVGAFAMNAIGPAGIVLAVVVGTAAGMINGVLIGFFRIQPIIVTLGMLLFARGLALALAGGSQTVSLASPETLMPLGYGGLFGIPAIAVFAAVMAALVLTLLARLRLGRRFFMIGSNPRAAALVGVRVAATATFAYALCGLAASAAGIVFLSRAGAGLPTEGSGLELQAIAAAVIGGTALSGGIGAAVPVLIGALFIQSLLNGLNLLGTSPFIAEIVLGLVLALAGLLDFIIRRLGAARFPVNLGESP